MTAGSAEHSPPGTANAVRLSEASRFWLQLGWVSFGGPAGQIALLHRELVERRRWLSEQRYLHALNYCMLLPGPEATQLATYLGWLMHGIPGGLMAGGLFLAPSVVVLTALTSAYVIWGGMPLLSAMFITLKPVVLAIVVTAAWRVGRRTLHSPLLTGVAVAAFAGLAVLHLPYPLVVLSAALAGGLVGRWRPAWLGRRAPGMAATGPNAPALHGDHSPTPDHAQVSSKRLAETLLAWGLATALPLSVLTAIGGWNGTLSLMARFFSRVALLSFGGAYAVLPYVAQGAVEQFGWLTADQMLDGMALGETTPGPLIMVVAFVGFMGGWSSPLLADVGAWWAALAAALTTVWFTFVPSFGLILVGAPLVEASRDDLRLTAPLTAITAAVVGTIASLAIFLSGPVMFPAGTFNPLTGCILTAALFAQLKLQWSVLRLIGVAAAAGLCAGALAP